MEIMIIANQPYQQNMLLPFIRINIKGEKEMFLKEMKDTGDGQISKKY